MNIPAVRLRDGSGATVPDECGESKRFDARSSTDERDDLRVVVRWGWCEVTGASPGRPFRR
jgi:hypothetical protein